ncbi:something about silencing protein sas10, putative [Perkinsus marinus ATCC 50983]|uniref:Something about silencing protein sas10, putative n=1 Tax=Perkinsus marinus (strain ATCC 50983 / TXsc) TaxID=423536 RepID=C5LLZ3_PERM5|nr:something about silencing protein sas10, putative [Perkinsus marinus ATCC 50983]EER02250.1 something about silencing protein sas10, putative [Perkinsus marinus ATCC 50983]|eukprot:XP_002769532.1 something about silencing protein sas10, putative [Perkinsus marinus ATCC 50983]
MLTLLEKEGSAEKEAVASGDEGSDDNDDEDDDEDFDFAPERITFKGDTTDSKKPKEALSRSERRRLAIKESPELEALLAQYREGAISLGDEARDLLEAVRKCPPPGGKGGMTFVETKVQLLLSYLSYLSYYFMLKSRGASVRKHPVIGKIAWVKGMIERLKPIEKNIGEQVEELISRSQTTAGPDPEMAYLDDILAGLGVEQLEAMDEVSEGEEEEVEGEGEETEEEEEPAKVSKAQLVERLSRGKEPVAVEESGLDEEGILARMAARDDEDAVALLRPRAGAGKKGHGKLRAKVKGGKGYAGVGSVSLDEVAEVKDLVDGRANLADILNSAKQVEEAASGRKGRAGGDDDVEVRQGMSMREIRATMEEEADDAKEVQNAEDVGEEAAEPSMMLKARKARDAKRQSKKATLAAKAQAFMPEEENEVDLRSTNYAINKNKGLTRKRKKEDRNARVKNRNRYERAVKRRKGAVQEVREASADGTYSGEATGIRTNVKKSVKLG